MEVFAGSNKKRSTDVSSPCSKSRKEESCLTSDSGRLDSEFQRVQSRSPYLRRPCLASLFGRHYVDHQNVVRLADRAERFCRVIGDHNPCPCRQHPCFSGHSSFCHLPCS